MDLWNQYNIDEDIDPLHVIMKLYIDASVNDPRKNQYKKEYNIQIQAEQIKSMLHSLNFDYKQYNDYINNFPSFDVEYCKLRFNETTSNLLKWHYGIMLYVVERGIWLKNAIPLMLDSAKNQNNELRSISYLVTAFNLNKLYDCKQEIAIKETALYFIRNRQDNMHIYNCVVMVSVLEKSSRVKSEILEIVLKLSEQMDYPEFENFLKSAIAIAPDKNSVRTVVAQRYENYGDQQESLLKISCYQKALGYCDKNEDKTRIFEKIQIVDKQIPLRSFIHQANIQPIEIQGKNSFERLKYLVGLFRYVIPKVDAMWEQTENLRNEFPLAAAFTRIPIRETAIPTAYSNSIEDSTHSDYVENYTLEVKYWAEVLSSSVRDYEENMQITTNNYLDYLHTFELHEQAVLKLIECGIQRHYEKDYISSIHILIPQVENTLRRLLEQKGISVLRSHNQILQYLTLGSQIESSRPILGTDLVEFLRIKLVEDDGINLRNRVCHSIYEDLPKLEDYDALHDFSHATSLSLILIIMLLTRLCTSFGSARIRPGPAGSSPVLDRS